MDDKIPLPIDLAEYESEREFQEDAMESPDVRPIVLPTLEDAQRAAKRVAVLRKKAAEVESLFVSEEAVLQQELEKVRKRREEALKLYERRMGWYLFALEEFHQARLQADPKEKTIKLPAGDLTLKAQQPEWDYGETDAVTAVLRLYRPELVRVEEKPDKAALKKAARVYADGNVYIEDGNGELHQLPITVTERPPKFDFKPA